MDNLEKRLRRLSSLSNSAEEEISDAIGHVGDFVNDALAGIMNRVRESAANVGQSVADEASQLGNKAVKRVVDEIEHRPLMMLAVALGVGFLVGFANRR